MKQSIFRMKKIEKLKKKAMLLYKQGLSSREVGKMVGKSHQWVLSAVKELST